MDIFRNEFIRRLNSLGLRDLFFEDCVEILRKRGISQDESEPSDQVTQLKTLLEASEQSRQAKDVLVEANLRLVISIAKPYARRPVPLPDLIQKEISD